ncbi:MAG: sodium/proline symporter PutP [Nitrospiraceae bacterium]|nr:MAG: sodium/proline symporter PutP [Nitrospiraceae bacterium]
MNTPEITTFIIYFIAVLIVGVIFYRLTGNLSDYILGGRSLGSSVAALSAGASDMSGWLLLGLPGALYASGMNQIWIAIGLTFGAYLNWQFIAGRLRQYTEYANNSITIPDYLENRFHDRSRILRIISALVILVFFTIYVSSGLVAGAILFEKTFGLSYQIALWVGARLIVSYTFLGGFLAVSWTDFFQGLLMLLALMVVPFVAITKTGGWDAVLSRVAAHDPRSLDAFSGMTVMGILSLMAWGLGYFGQPHILARFMAIRLPGQIPRARLIGMSWMVLSLYGAILVGFTGIAYFSRAPLENPETVFIGLSQDLFNPWVSGILLAAILSAIMSTIDSQLLVCSSALTEDFYKAIFRRSSNQRELVLIGRLSVLAIALLAVLMASDPGSRVLTLVAYAWAGFGASFGPVIILSLFWKRMTRNGALAGMLIGAVTVIVWKRFQGGIFDLYEIVPGFVLSSLGIVVVSLLDREVSREIQREFDLL